MRRVSDFSVDVVKIAHNRAGDGVTNLRDRCNRYFETMANGTKQIQDHITGHVMPLEYSTGHQDLLDPRLM